MQKLLKKAKEEAEARAAEEKAKEEAETVQKPAKQILAEMSNAQKKACWAQFLQTFTTANERGARDAEEKCPADLMLTVISQQEKKTWYNIWSENGMKWSRVRMSEQFNTTDRQVDGSIYAWLTECQICDLYMRNHGR